MEHKNDDKLINHKIANRLEMYSRIEEKLQTLGSHKKLQQMSKPIEYGNN